MLENVAIWMALFGFFTVEHVKALGERVAILRVGPGGRIAVHIPYAPLQVMGRTVHVLPMFRFLEAQYIGNFGSASTGRSTAPSREIKRLLLNRKALLPILILEPALAVFYFILCPALSLKFGFGYALRFILPVHVLALVACAVLVLRQSGRQLKSSKAKLTLIAELIISPGLMPALSKRLAGKLRVGLDVPSCVSSSLDSAAVVRMNEVLTYRVKELVDFGEMPKDEAEAYLMSVGAT